MPRRRGKVVSKDGPSKRMSNAFTLVELLVVIAIIALLMAILMPALQRVKKKAKEVKCRSNLRQVSLVIYMYLQDNDFKMPECYHYTQKSNRYFWFDPASGVPLKPSDESYWATAYWGLKSNSAMSSTSGGGTSDASGIPNRAIFSCPSFLNAAQVAGLDKLYDTSIRTFKDSAYSLNSFMDKAATDQMKNQGEVLIVQEHIEPKIENGREDMFFQYQGQGPLKHYTEGDRSNFYRGIFRHSTNRSDPFRTGGRANVLWLDMHVSALEESDIMDDLEGKARWYDPLGKWTAYYDG